MISDRLPLNELSIDKLFYSGGTAIYEIPIYQRNYAWEKDEITAFVQDVYDACEKGDHINYYIGTLVSYKKDENVYEIIDGQQRLTTIRILLGVICPDSVPQSKLTYRARKKSDNTLRHIPDFDIEDVDHGIKNGFDYAKEAYRVIVNEDKKEKFEKYFRNNVKIIHYHVPKDVDLNHYFEVMNSRGEQLEKHEIVKAMLLSELKLSSDRTVFNDIWESCSKMGTYVQKSFDYKSAFSRDLTGFVSSSEDDLFLNAGNTPKKENKTMSINDLLKENTVCGHVDNEYPEDSFQPIIDFPNFLMIVLKITKMSEKDFVPTTFILDDKELLNEFNKHKGSGGKFVKRFGYNLLKAKFFLDNYIVHHINGEDASDSNPWELEVLIKEKREYTKNLIDEQALQMKLVHLLSMFEVSFTAHQRKNYLFYCLLFLFENYNTAFDAAEYCRFTEDLANKYLNDIYLVKEKLNEINIPVAGSFDETIIIEQKTNTEICKQKTASDFAAVYGDGREKTKGIPLFIFNYLDYKLWKYYDEKLRGKALKKGDALRKDFFGDLGCSDFELDVFKNFYFSRTRRSLEHFYPQAKADGKKRRPNENMINCFGNFTMIGNSANSMGSDRDPIEKLSYYLEDTKQSPKISTASIKFMIMMQRCRDNRDSRTIGNEWISEDIHEHEQKMLGILFR